MANEWIQNTLHLSVGVGKVKEMCVALTKEWLLRFIHWHKMTKACELAFRFT